jgi:hypothetical protein
VNIKEILTEWDCFKRNCLLLETSKNEVIEVIGENDYNTLVALNKKASQDQNFLKVIINTYKANQNHTIQDILGIYQNYTRFIAPSWNRGEEAKVDVPGGHRASLTPDFTTYDDIVKPTTYDDIVKFIEASSLMILKSKVYIKCLKQGPVNQDFEVIINDSDWIICYPKTIRGSISLARSFWNGSELVYDKSVSGGVGRMIGEMSWCTSVVSGGNMFLNYHRKMNLHMYYCIKKNMSVNEPDRKLCISFAKKKNKVKLMKKSSASVDANNDVKNEEEFRSYIGERFDALFRDAEKPERLEIDEKAFYESISLVQYKILRAANEDDLENFTEELEGILDYSRDKYDILKLVAKDNSFFIKQVAAFRRDLLKADPTGELIRQLAIDEDSRVRAAIANHKDLLEADPTGELIRKLVIDEDIDVRVAIARNKDLLKIDLSGSIIKTLAKDKDQFIRISIACREDLLEADPTGKLIRQLATDEDELVRSYSAANKNLLKIDPSGSIIKTLARDNNSDIRSTIACREDLLEADPTGKLIRQLAQDKSPKVRSLIALHNKDLLKIDPSGSIIKTLATDKNGTVRDYIKYNSAYDLSKLQINVNESIIREYIKYFL